MRYYGVVHDGGGYVPDEVDAKAKKLADMKAKREAELAEKSRIRREAAGLSTDTGFWADRNRAVTDVKNALAAVEADTGVEEALAIIAAQQALEAARDAAPVRNIVAQNQSAPGPVYAVPLTPAPVTYAESSIAKTETVAIKTATPDIILFDDSAIPVQLMQDLLFEDIGGQELINISRTDTINGQNIIYQPIKNINSINQEYNPGNILGLQKTSDKYFSGYAIKLEERVPKVSNSLDGNPVYLDSNGNLVVDSINLNADEQVEIQITVSGTIYEIELGEIIS
jgi:hypothetical protein